MGRMGREPIPMLSRLTQWQTDFASDLGEFLPGYFTISMNRVYWLKVCLRQVSASMLLQLWDDTSDTVLTENNGVTPEWGCNPFLSDFIAFNENSNTSVITKFS